MTPAAVQTKRTTPLAVAGRRVKKWIARSFASALRRHRHASNHHGTPCGATISSSPATDLLAPGLEDVVKATQPRQVVYDVLLPSETIEKASHPDVLDSAESPGSSRPPSTSGGLADGESDSDSTSSDEGSQVPPFANRRTNDECRDELGAKKACMCTPAIAVVPQSPPPSPRALSPARSASPGDGVSSIHTSDAGQIPDEEGMQVEITEIKQETDLSHTEGTSSDEVTPDLDPWGGSDVVPWPDLQGPSTTSPTSVAPDSAESEKASTILQSSDERMILTLRNFLGAGSYGRVVSAYWEAGDRDVAVKVSHKLFISELDCTEPGLRSLKNELEVLKALKQSKQHRDLGSNFFPVLLKSWQDAKNVYFAMDFYPWNLEDLRWADPAWDVTIGDKTLWAAELILGVQALHRMRILHRDIKPANIFVTSSKHLIIGDYGLAQAWLDPFYANFPSTSLKARDAPGTMAYLAPEVLKGFYLDASNVSVRKYASYGFEADIWSLGVTICDVWCRRTGLFQLQDGEEDLDYQSVLPDRILLMDVVPAVKERVDEHPIWHLITRMLDRNPKSRIGFNEMLAHPVFALLDWNMVAHLQYMPTWDFPEVEDQKPPKPVEDAIEFASYYEPPEDAPVDETASERANAEKSVRRTFQLQRRAMGGARDWASEQELWTGDNRLAEYDFDWTAPEVIDLENK